MASPYVYLRALVFDWCGKDGWWPGPDQPPRTRLGRECSGLSVAGPSRTDSLIVPPAARVVPPWSVNERLRSDWWARPAVPDRLLAHTSPGDGGPSRGRHSRAVRLSGS